MLCLSTHFFIWWVSVSSLFKPSPSHLSPTIPLSSNLHPSLPPSLSIDPAIVFCLPCAGWLALINIDNCLFSLHAKHGVFFLNESRSFPYATHLPLLPSLHVGIPPLMTGDNLLSLPIFFPSPPPPTPLHPVPLFIDYREISPCVAPSTNVNTQGHVARLWVQTHANIQIFRFTNVH